MDIPKIICRQPYWQYYNLSCKIEDIIDVIYDLESYDDFGHWSIPPLEQLNETLSNVSPNTKTIPVALIYVPKT
jgi:hypothetical protein